MTKITFEFDTSAYERTHGKAPKGYGSWAFDWQGSRRDPKPIWAPTSGNADAKRWVKEHIRLRAATANPEWNGHIQVTVCS